MFPGFRKVTFDFKVLYWITCSFGRKELDRLSFVSGIQQAFLILRERRKVGSRDKVLKWELILYQSFLCCLCFPLPFTFRKQFNLSRTSLTIKYLRLRLFFFYIELTASPLKCFFKKKSTLSRYYFYNKSTYLSVKFNEFWQMYTNIT